MYYSELSKALDTVSSQTAPDGPTKPGWQQDFLAYFSENVKVSAETYSSEERHFSTYYWAQAWAHDGLSPLIC